MRLILSGIWKSYDGNDVVRGFSYEFADGLVYALMGPNGCGKSTLLRIASLLEKPDKGAVIYMEDGKEVENNIKLQRRITILLPDVGVFNSTVFGNAVYGLRVRGLRGAEANGKALNALSLVGLSTKLKQNALTLSSGEKRRLGLARAMAIDPKMLFLDEPTTSIDEANKDIIENIIGGMRKRGRPTIILATHERQQAERLSDKVVMLGDYRL